jgi:hypothetical protein
MSKKNDDKLDTAPAAEAPPPAADARKPIEFWAEKHKTAASTFAGVKAGKQWPIGQEVTEEVYLAAIEWATSFPCR